MSESVTEKIKRLEDKLEKLKAEMEYYEQRSPGRGRVVSKLVEYTSLSNYVDSLKAELNQ